MKSPASSRRAGSTQSSVEDLFSAIHEARPGWQRQAFDEHFTLVRGLLLKALGPLVEIDDLLDDVFLRFFEGAHRIRSAQGVRSYIVSIAMNVARGEILDRKRRRVIGSILGNSEQLDETPSVDDPNAKAALLRLDRMLDELSTEQRLAFVLGVLEEMPAEDIAKALHTSVSTAKRRVKKATHSLKKRVARDPLLADYVIERNRGNHG